MRAFPLVPACGLVLALAGCDNTREGRQALFREPAPSAQFAVGATREAEVRALLGEPGGKTSGVLVAGNRFRQLSEEVREPGVPMTQWRYTASRRLGLGPWPFARHRLDTAYLTLAFDAAGVLRHMTHDDHRGHWEKGRRPQQAVLGDTASARSRIRFHA